MTERKRGGGSYLTMFGLIGLFFISILLVAYHYAKKANPVMLDDQGRPQQSHHS
jgi:preprotein translocase subunit SecG